MKAFVWVRLDKVSCSYHTEGGLLVVADSLEEAINLAEQDKYIKIEGASPDVIYEVQGGVEPKVIVFPDAGCC